MKRTKIVILILIFIIFFGFSFFIREISNINSLHNAVLQNNKNLVNEILASGYKIETPCVSEIFSIRLPYTSLKMENKSTALVVAVLNGKYEMAEELLKHGANVNSRRNITNRLILSDLISSFDGNVDFCTGEKAIDCNLVERIKFFKLFINYNNTDIYRKDEILNMTVIEQIESLKNIEIKKQLFDIIKQKSM